MRTETNFGPPQGERKVKPMSEKPRFRKRIRSPFGYGELWAVVCWENQQEQARADKFAQLAAHYVSGCSGALLALGNVPLLPAPIDGPAVNVYSDTLEADPLDEGTITVQFIAQVSHELDLWQVEQRLRQGLNGLVLTWDRLTVLDDFQMA